MKKLFFLLLSVLLIGGCMKSLDDEVLPDDPGTTVPGDETFQLKAGGAFMGGDTAYVAPNVYLKFYLDNMPGPVENYSFDWDLGNGYDSGNSSPEALYYEGVYNVFVLITPLSGGATIERSLVLVVDNSQSVSTTLILLEATPVAGGNYNYKLAMKSSVIENYNNTTGSKWIIGDFTNWTQTVVLQFTNINQIQYLVYNIVLPATLMDPQRFSFGKNDVWAYDPYDPFWSYDNVGAGAFEAYFHNGEMFPDEPIINNELPGDGGDLNENNVAATIRTQIMYGTTDYLRIYVNYAAYANGSAPFITQYQGNNNWVPSSLTMDSNGWAYKDYAIDALEGALYWRFGANVSQPTNFGIMTNSKFWLPGDQMLGLQVNQVKSSGKFEITVSDKVAIP